VKLLPNSYRQAAVVLLLSATGVASLAWWVIADETPTVLPPNTDTTWQLPTAPKPQDMSALVQKLRARPLWGRELTEAEKKTASAKQTWRLVGIVNEGSKKVALIADSEGKVKRYAPAANLPDDSILNSIASDSIKVQREEKDLETVYLYPRVAAP
jgi:hypothetical protein